MTNPNDWNALSNELEAIKHEAYQAGFNKASDDMVRLSDQISREKLGLERTIDSWHKALDWIRQSWTIIKDKDPNRTANHYQYHSVFGNKTIKGERETWRDPSITPIDLPLDRDEFGMALLYQLRKAQDFQILLDAFESNPMVKAQWERILVMMRMTDDTGN
jgi:hypothetical protein